MRYNIDGTMREETAWEAAESRAILEGRRLRNLPPPPRPPREVLLAEARASVALPKGAKPPPPPPPPPSALSSSSSSSSQQPGTAALSLPWSQAADRLMFGREGEAEFRRGSGEYDEFKGVDIQYGKMELMRVDFFVKFKSMRDHKKKLEQQLKSNDRMTDRATLPIKPFENQIVEMVKNNRVVLIAADTGAGKSTQVPQYLLSAGFDRIACTQPRRIACYSLAKRVSYESLNIYGSEIAYQVRFEGTKTAKTKILFLTEGLLLRQFAADPKLGIYNVVIVDEVHERHITGDFLLGVLKRILAIRDDIRLVLMSATINAELFSAYFNAPIINIPGRVYPVKIEYLPQRKKTETWWTTTIIATDLRGKSKNPFKPNPGNSNQVAHTPSFLITEHGMIEPYLKILERIDQIVPAHERGDLLVFVSGINEITKLAEDLKPYAVYTNVTIDGIRFIIDSGKVKEMGFDAKTGISRLTEYWISKSSAKQRTGRAGRTGPGEFDRMNEFPIPEILRMPLEATLLQVKAYGLGDPRTFELIEKPSDANMGDAIGRLENLGAVEIFEKAGKRQKMSTSTVTDADKLDSSLELTPLGRVLSILPVDVVLGKMLILGTISDVIDSTILMAAALAVPFPFTRVPDSQTDVIQNRKELMSEIGDPFTLLSVVSDWLRVKAARQNPEYIRRREQKELLERQKRLQSSSKRKILKMDSEFEDENDEVEDVVDMSIHHLEFSLKYSAADLLGKGGDASNLTLRDKDMLKLIFCSGLYPNVAIADPANASRPGSEQMFHTKGRRFVVMHPTSVFSSLPEILHPQSSQDEIDVKNADTLDKLRRKVKCKEVLCYMGLLHTNKHYLTNVLRVPAAPVCLLFAHKLDLTPDFEHPRNDLFVLANWLRIAWDLVVTRRLARVRHGLVTTEVGKEKDSEEEGTPTIRTKRVLTDWTSIEAIPRIVGRMRNDWESGSSRWSSPVYGDFENLEKEDVSNAIPKDKRSAKLYQLPDAAGPRTEMDVGAELPPPPASRSTKSEASTNQDVSAFRRPIACSSCGETLFLTPIEALRHKRNCKA
ncbi:P-loop containing nucleoside triphosphate hydrolase protein [Chytridium lagenaria]|nr:P-loop containing nucleoside triphosphate hydrolase protein [Chytridium lagenaria]